MSRVLFLALVIFPGLSLASSGRSTSDRTHSQEGESSLLWQASYTPVNHSFEVISQALSQQLEESYEVFFLINTEEGPTKMGAFIPNQHMLVVRKSSSQRLIFTRSSLGVITGLQPGVQQLSDIVPASYLENGQADSFGLPFDWNGLEVLPVSTGTLYHMPTFSGIFQINWERSRQMNVTDESQPMSHSLYIGYYYHDNSLPKKDWNKDTREQVSYVAIHGTPQKNWPNLGRTRASHGCARARAPIMEALYDVIDGLPLKEVVELNWDFELPVTDTKTIKKLRKPVMVLLFNGYD